LGDVLCTGQKLNRTPAVISLIQRHSIFTAKYREWAVSVLHVDAEPILRNPSNA
jgi:hypothetical protein